MQLANAIQQPDIAGPGNLRRREAGCQGLSQRGCLHSLIPVCLLYLNTLRISGVRKQKPVNTFTLDYSYQMQGLVCPFPPYSAFRWCSNPWWPRSLLLDLTTFEAAHTPSNLAHLDCFPVSPSPGGRGLCPSLISSHWHLLPSVLLHAPGWDTTPHIWLLHLQPHVRVAP